MGWNIQMGRISIGWIWPDITTEDHIVGSYTEPDGTQHSLYYELSSTRVVSRDSTYLKLDYLSSADFTGFTIKDGNGVTYEFAAASKINLKAFTYTVGQTVPAQGIAKRTSLPQVAHMPGMKQVEAAVREHEPSAPCVERVAQFPRFRDSRNPVVRIGHDRVILHGARRCKRDSRIRPLTPASPSPAWA